MPVFAKTLPPEWRKAFEEFEALTGFEMMYQDDVDAGKMTPRQAWAENQQWLEGLVADANHIPTPFDIED